MCLSIQTAVCHKPVLYRYHWTNRAGFSRVGFFPCVVRKFLYHACTQNKGASLWNFAPNSGLRKCHHGKSVALSTKLVDGRACCQHHVRQLTSRGCLLHVGQLYPSNSITGTAICCGFAVQLVCTVDKILTDIARRAVRLR